MAYQTNTIDYGLRITDDRTQAHRVPASSATSCVHINLDAIERNLRCFRALLQHGDTGTSETKVCGVVKANAYGQGAIEIAGRLVAGGIDMLAVYSLHQAEQIVGVTGDCPILVFLPVRQLNRNDTLFSAIAAGYLHLSVVDLEQIEQLGACAARLGIRLPVHLHLDTGMSRTGLTPQNLETALSLLQHFEQFRLKGIYTHLACADSSSKRTMEQLGRIKTAVASHQARIPGDCLMHIANTFGTLLNQKLHADLVRIGLGLYGYGPELISVPVDATLDQPLCHAVRWVSWIEHVAPYPRGTAVGYGGTHILERDSLLGVVPVGYGDGYPVALSNRGVVCLSNSRWGHDVQAPILGQVNMDQLVIDLTDIGGTAEELLHEEIVLISDDSKSPCSMPNIAVAAGTHCYEIMCRIAATVPRIYEG